MQESSLHAALKDWYSSSGDRQEVDVDGFLVDVVKGNLLIEIQTQNFSAIKKKLIFLLDKYPVKLVYPIAREKWIVALPASSNRPKYRRKSPKKGRPEDVFRELVRIPDLIAQPNFCLELIFVQIEEIRRDDGRGSWRRKGMSIADRRLLSVLDTHTYRSKADFLAMLPTNLPGSFTNKQLAKHLKISPALARKMTYCLRGMEGIETVGKKGNAYLFRIMD